LNEGSHAKALPQPLARAQSWLFGSKVPVQHFATIDHDLTVFEIEGSYPAGDFELHALALPTAICFNPVGLTFLGL
jgi:hypothetical protein